jgi:hypothetical protein
MRIRTFPPQTGLLAILPAGGGRETVENKERMGEQQKEMEKTKKKERLTLKKY